MSLTPRQRDVLIHVATGMSDKQIARELGISPATVKNHLRSLYARLGIHNRTQAARYVMTAMQ